MKGEERGHGHEARKENIFSICEERVQSSSSDQVRGSKESGNLLLCSFKMEGRRKKNEQKWVESNPTRGRNQHSKAGIYSGRALSLSGWKKISLLLSLCDVFCLVYRWNVCASLCMQHKLEGVSVIYMVNTVAPLTRCTWGGIFLSLFLHSFLYFSFYSHISVPDYLVVIQIKELIVLSLVLHALEIHPVPQDTWGTQ